VLVDPGLVTARFCTKAKKSMEIQDGVIVFNIKDSGDMSQGPGETCARLADGVGQVWATMASPSFTGACKEGAGYVSLPDTAKGLPRTMCAPQAGDAVANFLKVLTFSQHHRSVYGDSRYVNVHETPSNWNASNNINLDQLRFTEFRTEADNQKVKDKQATVKDTAAAKLRADVKAGKDRLCAKLN
jgi:hypothetical protein